jgi:hypothetical protein
MVQRVTPGPHHGECIKGGNVQDQGVHCLLVLLPDRLEQLPVRIQRARNTMCYAPVRDPDTAIYKQAGRDQNARILTGQYFGARLSSQVDTECVRPHRNCRRSVRVIGAWNQARPCLPPVLVLGKPALLISIDHRGFTAQVGSAKVSGG